MHLLFGEMIPGGSFGENMTSILEQTTPAPARVHVRKVVIGSKGVVVWHVKSIQPTILPNADHHSTRLFWVRPPPLAT